MRKTELRYEGNINPFSTNTIHSFSLPYSFLYTNAKYTHVTNMSCLCKECTL